MGQSTERIPLTGVIQINRMTPMKIKTQVYFDEADLKALRRVAKARGRPVAELIREAVKTVLLPGPARGPVDLFNGPLNGTSVEHDSAFDHL